VSALIIVAAILFEGTLCIWVWRLVVPDRWRWLSVAELEKVQVLVFSGAASSLATVLSKRMLGPDEPKSWGPISARIAKGPLFSSPQPMKILP